jgi:hypothetical protein
MKGGKPDSPTMNLPDPLNIKLLPEKETKWAHIRKNLWTISSVIIACAALYLSYDQARLTREHNRLSVRPHITISAIYRHDIPAAGIRMSNTGVGPAEIRKFAVYVRGQQMMSWNEALNAIGVAQGLIYFQVPLPTSLKRVSTSDPNAIEGEDILLLIKGDAQRVKQFSARFKEMEIQCIYCSLYKDCWERVMEPAPPEEVPYPEHPKMMFFWQEPDGSIR